MTATAAREAAIRVLRAVRRGALADRALRRAQAGLDARERSLLQELVYGTLRLRGRLDHRIARVSSRGLHRIDAETLDVLRLGAYQLTEMGGIPAYAAVSESVELVKRRSRGASGFVNGVLKAVSAADPAAGFPHPDDHLAYLSSWGSHPRWLVDRWLSRFGPEGTRRLVEANNQRPALYLRPLEHTAEEACERLGRSGIGAHPVSALRAIRLDPGCAPEAALAVVPAVVQDPASGLVVDVVAPVDATVADVCAAPGGKALALAGAGARYVLASDVSEGRMRRLRENVRRVPDLPIGLAVADGRQPPFDEADIVLVDAPCSGTGTLRRHPDARWRVRPDDIAALAGLQDAILGAAAKVVAPGGVLVYATCTLEPEENEQRVTMFQREHPDFAAEECTAVSREYVDENGRLSVLPHVHGFDGAFAVRMRRRH